MNRLIVIFLSIVALSLVAPLSAQEAGGTEVTGAQKTALAASIEKAHKQLSTLSASFTQEKTSTLFTEKVVQKGKLNYKAPKQLRWEYTSPKAMTVIFSNGKVLMKNEQGTTSNPHKMLGEMGNMIINTINGSFIKENADFNARYFKNKSGQYVVVLTPVNKKIKAYYKTISITLSGSTFLADKVILTESSGDTTTITFTDKKSNIPLSDSLFK
jgi:outer membrane lipoprotein-sorting protein